MMIKTTLKRNRSHARRLSHIATTIKMLGFLTVIKQLDDGLVYLSKSKSRRLAIPLPARKAIPFNRKITKTERAAIQKAWDAIVND